MSCVEGICIPLAATWPYWAALDAGTLQPATISTKSFSVPGVRYYDGI